MYMTQQVMPHKLVFRSGWNPGDLYMLVECYPRHDPLNPTAILSLQRYSAAFAEMSSENSSAAKTPCGSKTYRAKRPTSGSRVLRREEVAAGLGRDAVHRSGLCGSWSATHAQCGHRVYGIRGDSGPGVPVRQESHSSWCATRRPSTTVFALASALCGTPNTSATCTGQIGRTLGFPNTTFNRPACTQRRPTIC